jgi:hypothetical protein
MNIYKKILKIFPASLSEDVFIRKDSADNSLTMYACEQDLNRRRSLVDKFWREGHRFLKACSLSVNFFDRRLARWQIGYLRQKAKRDPVLKRNEIFKNKHQGQRCFILGQGPSLAKQDLAPLAKEITIASNTFWKHPILSSNWQPTYYSAVHFETFYDKSSDRPGFENPALADILDYYQNARAKIFGAKYIIPISGWLANRKYNFFPEEQTFAYSVFPYPVFEFLPEFPNLSVGLPWAQDSSQYAIMIAMYMGCNPIILLGCDHDWYINLGEEKRFFDEGAFKNGKKFDSSKIPMTENMWYAWVLWRGHENLKRLADKHGIKIINATGGGVLDVYTIAKYEDLINQQPTAL